MQRSTTAGGHAGRRVIAQSLRSEGLLHFGPAARPRHWASACMMSRTPTRAQFSSARSIVCLLIAIGVFAPSSPLIVHASDTQAPTRQAQRSDDPSFDILEFVVEGNRVLMPAAIERAVYPYLGDRRNIKDAEAARTALEKAYHDAGYLTVVVDIPEQKVDAGVVRLNVVEGRVERLRIAGARHYAQGYIRARVPSLAPGVVPNFPQAQEELAQVNRGPDRRVTPVLRPGRGPGTVEVELKVEDQLPLHGSVELTNRKSPNTSELRLGGGLRYDNLWQRDHSVGVQFQTAPKNTDDVKVLSLNYLLPLGHAGAQLLLYAVESRSDVAALGGVNVIGDGTILGARYILPLPARGNYIHSVSVGFDRKDFRETVTLLGADSTNTPITYAPLVAQYTLTIPGEQRRTQVSIGGVLGLRDVLGNRDRDFANKRDRARANFLALKADIEHEYLFRAGWSMRGRVDLQLANQPLISNEQFSGGGTDSVRGYLENEVQGDDGVRLRFEAQSPPLVKWDEKQDHGISALAFLEATTLRVQDPLPAQQRHFTLASTGVALRLRAGRHWSGGLDLAWPLRDTARTEAGAVRVHVRLGYEF